MRLHFEPNGSVAGAFIKTYTCSRHLTHLVVTSYLLPRTAYRLPPTAYCLYCLPPTAYRPLLYYLLLTSYQLTTYYLLLTYFLLLTTHLLLTRYLLEKSRCVAITDPERNYHSFYQAHSEYNE